ncbi:MAG: metallophosphoesterase, partial [Clostridia bacterium]|nr:metallophosphoesterase [Clostridia bacterium]
MGTKLFVASDIHGHYTELMEALNKAGFDKDNPSHYFVSCGDLFDRGTENPLVYDFVKGLKHKFLIKGNHEELLYKALERGYINRVDAMNGTDI